MNFRILHRTTYRYTEPVRPGPHRVRLRPRADDSLRLLEYALRVSPEPSEFAEHADRDGNAVAQLGFAGETRELVIESRFQVETRRVDPGVHHVAAGVRLPPPYSPALAHSLAPYMTHAGRSPGVTALSAGLVADSQGELEGFLSGLNSWLHRSITREIRESGGPQLPERTLARGRGACRDLAVLFIAVCRENGIAARFVSGYQKRGSDRSRRHMHAWPEVYLPGCGWRGYDPTHGEPVADEHVALAAAASPDDAAPIEGSYFGAAASAMTVDLDIEVGP